MLVMDQIMKTGDIPEKEMYNVFNMGIGFVIAVEKEEVENTLNKLKEINEPAYIIGEITDKEEVDLVW